MIDVKIEKNGIIVEGIDVGWNIIIHDLQEGSGAYLIVVTPPRNCNSSLGYDHWVENFQALNEYFKEAKWRINWSSVVA